MIKSMPSYLLGAALLTAGAVHGATVTKQNSRPTNNVVQHLQNRSEVSFVTPPCLLNDVAAKHIPVTLTAAALAELLDGYNYGAVWDREGRLETVIVSSRVEDPDAACPEEAGENPDAPVQQVSQAPEPLPFYEPMPAEMSDR